MPVIPILAGVVGGVGTGAALAGAATLATTGIGLASAIKGSKQAGAAANQAAAAPAPTVDIAALDAQAREIARKNAADSAALEAQFNPGAGELRSGSLQALLAQIGQLSGPSGGLPSLSPAPVRGTRFDDVPAEDARVTELIARITGQAGQPLTTTGFDSALTRDAIARAREDLALGGDLPQDVRNLVARRALGKSGAVSGGLTLGRDLTARDLGLTTLDLRNQRLAQALQAGGAEVGLEQANAAMRNQAEQFGRTNLLQSEQAVAEAAARRDANYNTAAARSSANYATDAQIAAQRDALASGNYFNQENLLQNIASGNFARAFGAAQLGQNIAQPTSGLDPGSITNLAVGNTNALAQKQQQDAALRIQAANQKTQFGSQLLGTGLGFIGNFMNRGNASTISGMPLPPAPTIFNKPWNPPAPAYNLGTFCWVARECFGENSPEWTRFRDWMLTKGSPELVDFYGKNGEAIAAEISDQPMVKELIRHLMNAAKEAA